MTTPTLVLRGGRVATPAATGGFAEAMAVAGDTIVAMGSNEEIDALRAPSTRVVDLAGRLALPAFGDAHVHAVSAGVESLRCNLLGLRTRHECLAAIAAYAAGRGESEWVVGGGWSLEAFPGTPSAADLDAAGGGRPAFLPNRDHHSAWVSTRALDLAGIDASTPDPPNGRIERDDAGRPTGTLHESAMALVARLVPATSPEELADGLRAALATLHALGVTHWQDACVGDAGDIGVTDTFETYASAARDGWLSARIRGALWWDRHAGLEQVPFLLGRREAAPDGAFRATSVKVMVDGVCETFTAAMSRAYLGAPGRGGAHRGELFIEPEELSGAVAALDAEGFQVHFHAIGDRAVSTTLDALDALGPTRWGVGRHHIAHLQFIAPPDLDRFARLGAVATFQPLWACSDPQMEELTIPFVGEERAAWQYSIGSLWSRGARVAFGSDWPVSSPDPLQEIHVAVNRTLSPTFGRPGTDETTRPFRPREAVPVAAAVDAFTRSVAYVNGDDHLLGSLEVGRRADVAVLNQDIYAVAPGDIGATSVDLTVAGGAVVHGDE
ncbi:MAG: amidohydrolase [Acidobacteriota bacterium]|nr:amidohydrolase [Acidobacteriota bacterium]